MFLAGLVQALASGLDCGLDGCDCRVAPFHAAPDDVARVHALGSLVPVSVPCGQRSRFQPLQLLSCAHHGFGACASQDQGDFIAVVHAETSIGGLIGLVARLVLSKLFGLA